MDAVDIEFQVSGFAGDGDTTLTDIDGNYGFTNVPVGLFEVSAQSEARGASDTGEVTEDGDVVTVDMMLEASGTVIGRLLRSDSVTVSAHTVVLTYSTPAAPSPLPR